MGNDVSRPSPPLLKTAVVGLACASQVTAFAPRPMTRSGFANKPCPQFLYLGDAQGPLSGKKIDFDDTGITDVNRDFIIPPPSLALDDAWMAEMELEMEMKLSDLEQDFEDEEMESTAGPHAWDEGAIPSKGVKNKAPPAVSLLETDKDMEDDVLSPIRMQFEAISKNLDAALDELVDEFETAQVPATPIPVKTENKLHFITEGRLVNDYNGDSNDDDGDDSDDDSVASLFGETVDSIVHCANTVELPFFASMVEKSKAKRTSKAQRNTHESFVPDVDVKPVKNRVPVHSDRRPAFGFQRSLLAARLKMEQKAKDRKATMMNVDFDPATHDDEYPDFTSNDNTQSNEEDRMSRSQASKQGKRLIEAFCAATNDKELAVKALRNAQEEEKIQLSRLEEIQELTKKAIRLNEEKRRLTSDTPISVNETKVKTRRFDEDARRKIESEDTKTAGRPTFIVQSGKKDSQARHDSLSLEMDANSGRPTYIIQHSALGDIQNDESTLPSLHVPKPPKEAPQASRPTYVIEHSVLRNDNIAQPRLHVPRPPKEAPPDFIHNEPVTTNAIASTDTTSQADMSSSIVRTFTPVEGFLALKDSKDGVILESVATHVSKAVFYGGKAAFFTLRGMFEAAASEEVVSSAKAASSSISSSAQFISEAFTNATEAERYASSSGSEIAETIADSADGDFFLEMTKGVGNVVLSLGSVGGTFLHNFMQSTHAIEALAAAADTTNECVSLLTSVLALGIKQGERTARYIESTGKEHTIAGNDGPVTCDLRSLAANDEKVHGVVSLETKPLSFLQDFIMEQYDHTQDYLYAFKKDMASKFGSNREILDGDGSSTLEANPLGSAFTAEENHVGRTQNYGTKFACDKDKRKVTDAKECSVEMSKQHELDREGHDRARATNNTSNAEAMKSPSRSNLVKSCERRQQAAVQKANISSEQLNRDVQDVVGVKTETATSVTSFESNQLAWPALETKRDENLHEIVMTTPTEDTATKRIKPKTPVGKKPSIVKDYTAADVVVRELSTIEKDMLPSNATAEETQTSDKSLPASVVKKDMKKDINRTVGSTTAIAKNTNAEAQATYTAEKASMDDTNTSAIFSKKTTGKDNPTSLTNVQKPRKKNGHPGTSTPADISYTRTALVPPKARRMRDDAAVDLFRSLFHF